MVKKESGFTLVEVMISMVILTSITLLATSAYSIFSKGWSKQLGRFNSTTIDARNRVLVQKSLSRIFPYVVQTKNREPALYFEGNINGFVAVSLQSFADPNLAAVVRLSAVQNQDFTYKLIYEESPMVMGVLEQAEQEINFNEPVTLFDNLKNVKFTYYGWANRSEKFPTEESRTGKLRAREFNEYNSLELQTLPESVKVVLEQGDSGYTMNVNLLTEAANTLFGQIQFND